MRAEARCAPAALEFASLHRAPSAAPPDGRSRVQSARLLPVCAQTWRCRLRLGPPCCRALRSARIPRRALTAPRAPQVPGLSPNPFPPPRPGAAAARAASPALNELSRQGLPAPPPPPRVLIGHAPSLTPY